jgi:hypothetical protein
MGRQQNRRQRKRNERKAAPHLHRTCGQQPAGAVLAGDKAGQLLKDSEESRLRRRAGREPLPVHNHPLVVV